MLFFKRVKFSVAFVSKLFKLCFFGIKCFLRSGYWLLAFCKFFLGFFLRFGKGRAGCTNSSGFSFKVCGHALSKSIYNLSAIFFLLDKISNGGVVLFRVLAFFCF